MRTPFVDHALTYLYGPRSDPAELRVPGQGCFLINGSDIAFAVVLAREKNGKWHRIHASDPRSEPLLNCRSRLKGGYATGTAKLREHGFNISEPPTGISFGRSSSHITPPPDRAISRYRDPVNGYEPERRPSPCRKGVLVR